jgi:hypothetical protein
VALPPLPKELRSVGAPKADEQARRTDEWARGSQALLKALREGDPVIQRRLAELEVDVAALEAGGGGGSVSYGAHVDLTVGGSGTDGANTTVSRSDHVHGLPAFGTTAGTFCEGNDPRLGLGALDTYDRWDPDAPAASPHSLDDDATSGSLDGQWTLWDPGTILTTAATSRGYSLSATGNSGQRWAGYYVASPASEFQFSARVGLEAPGGTTSAIRASILVGQDLTGSPGTSDFRDAGLGCVTTGYQTNGGLWTAWNGSNSATSNQQSLQSCWIRIRCNGTAFECDASSNGLTWFRFGTHTLAFTPAEIGFGIGTLTSAIPVRGLFSHFRIASGAGTSDFFTGYDRGRLVRRAIAP